MSHDSNRTRIWFPMFSYFESSVDGIIPNEYESITTLLSQICTFVLSVKDAFMLTTQRFWVQNGPINNQLSAKSSISSIRMNSSATKLLKANTAAK